MQDIYLNGPAHYVWWVFSNDATVLEGHVQLPVSLDWASLAWRQGLGLFS